MAEHTINQHGRPWTGRAPEARDVTHDAVIIIPGIMGSALRDTTTGRQVWGFEDLRWLVSAWRRPEGMLPLHLSDEERSGRYGRIEATSLLRFPAWAPFLRGVEPYNNLLAAVRQTVAHPDAVLPFPYDWRLPVEVNGVRLADAAHRHLAHWRASEAHQRARQLHPDQREARLVFVAHSMGGLVTRAAFAHAAAQGSDLAPQVRAVVTLGTPFLGSVKAAVILGGHRSDPRPSLLQRRMQALAATLPGVHDLLPDYRCVDVGPDVNRLTPQDVAALGGDAELAAASQTFQERMRGPHAPRLPGHRAVVGVAQPTAQSLRLDSGVLRKQYVAFQRNGDGELARDPATGIPLRRDRAGDGTVYRDAAALPGAAQHPLPLQHGALARESDAVGFIRAVLTEHDPDLGPALGPGNLGLDVPDSADAGRPWLLRLVPAPGATLDTYAGISCTVHSASTDQWITTPRVSWYDGTIAARVTLPAPGLYRIRVDTGTTTLLTQLVLATDPSRGS